MRLPLVATLARKKCVLHWLHSVCPGAPWVCLEMFETRTPRSCPIFLLLCQEDPSLEDVCRKISNVVFEQNRVVTESATTIFAENTSRQAAYTSEWTSALSATVASNFEACHALEATTVMKTHLGCCSIKWIHIGFLLVAIWRSYLTTSLQNVCVCVHATEWFASSGGALKKSLKSPGNSRYPSTCLFLQ